MTQSAEIGAVMAGSYLLGSLPFGLWLAKVWKGIDIRKHGSGNIGATNVMRVCGKPVGITVFTLDVLKGLIPPLVANVMGLSASWQILSAMLAILGHIFPVWLGFKGGKGVATGLGAFVGVAPYVGLFNFAVWILLVFTTRIVSVASIVAAILLSVMMPVFYPGDNVRLAFGIVCSVLGLITHRANIKRLLNGTETRLGQKKHDEEEPPDAGALASVSGGPSPRSGTNAATPPTDTV